MMDAIVQIEQPHDYDIGNDRSLILVDADVQFVKRLAKAMERRGFLPETAQSVSEAKLLAAQNPPAYAVLDLRLDDGNGIDIVKALCKSRPDCRIVILTGYGAIASAVAAVKAGATDYLSKPADPDEIAHALLAANGSVPTVPDHPMSADRVKWEHIQRIFELCDRNVSETARRLSMHRRTLQRILAKRAPR
jgi:two-component system, response regulator RegA